jgi:hypothetical protein
MDVVLGYFSKANLKFKVNCQIEGSGLRLVLKGLSWE